jgi:hypothetical protein
MSILNNANDLILRKSDAAHGTGKLANAASCHLIGRLLAAQLSAASPKPIAKRKNAPIQTSGSFTDLAADRVRDRPIEFC